MAIFKGKKGEWKTSETGVHYFIPNGMTPEEAWKQWSENKREYKTYWIDDERKSDTIYSSHGVRKKEYEEELAKGKTGFTKVYGGKWTEHIPDDIEYQMDDALSKITSTTGKKDFFNQLRSNLKNVNMDNRNAIYDAFDEEIKNHYNKLIEPNIKRIESINKDNAADIFNNSLKINGFTTKTEFSNEIKTNFDQCKNEECKILVAGLTSEFGLEFTNNDNDKDGTYFDPLNNNINIQTYDNDTPTLYHECGHKLFDLHNIKNTDLLSILKSEMGHKGITKIQTHFRNLASKDLKYESYDQLLANVEKEKEIVDKKFFELEEKFKSEYGPHTYLNTNEHYQFVHKNEELVKLKSELDIARIKVNRVNDLGRRYCRENTVLPDMISAATLNTHNDKYGFGHTQTYWRQDKNLQADEFWAEMIELKASGNTKEYELIKSFCPKAVTRFEQLFDEVYKKRGEILKL